MRNKLGKEFTLSKYGVDVRYVEEGDAQFILDLRTSPKHSRFLSATDNDLNKQKMEYSLFEKGKVIYETDKDGNPIIEYVDDNGNVYYRQDGTIQDVYAEPKTIWVSLNSSLREAQFEEWGIDEASYVYSQIKIEKGILPKEFGYGTKLWYESPVGRKEDGTVDEDSADYTVKGVMTDRLQFDFYLLQRNNNAKDNNI